METNYWKTILLLLLVSAFFYSCKKDDPVPEIDQEVITEMTLSFKELDEGGKPIEGTGFKAVAKDSEGISLGGSPEIDPIRSLLPGKTYQMSIDLYNHFADEVVTDEIKEHGNEHQFFFLGSGLVGEAAFLEYDYGDSDVNGRPIGLEGLLTVDESPGVNHGSLRIILRHGLNKGFSGADQPIFENFETAGGESDLDITFPVDFDAAN